MIHTVYYQCVIALVVREHMSEIYGSVGNECLKQTTYLDVLREPQRTKEMLLPILQLAPTVKI